MSARAVAMVPEQLLSVTEVAKQLSCSRAHVYRLIEAGQLGRVDIGHGARPKTRIRASELAAFQRRRSIPAERRSAQ